MAPKNAWSSPIPSGPQAISLIVNSFPCQPVSRLFPSFGAQSFERNPGRWFPEGNWCVLKNSSQQKNLPHRALCKKKAPFRFCRIFASKESKSHKNKKIRTFTVIPFLFSPLGRTRVAWSVCRTAGAVCRTAGASRKTACQPQFFLTWT